MRTTYRILSATIALGAAFPIGMPTAYAEDVSALQPSTAAWFWDKQTSGSLPVVGVGTPTVPSQLSNVDTDRYAVSYQRGTETTASGDSIAAPEKETYLMWDIYDIVESGSTIDSFVVTLPLDPDAESNKVPYGPDGARPELIACKPVGGFGPASGDAFASKPKDDCTDAVFSSFDAAKQAYVFDITTYAQDWVDQDNFGIAIRPKTDETIPYQLQFKAQADILANLSFTPPVAVEEPVFEEPEYVAPPVVDTGTVVQPDLGGFVPVPQPQAQPPAAPKPVVVTEAPRQIRRAAATPFVEDFTLSKEFWGAALFGVVLLGIVSLILGDDRVRVREAGKDSTLDRVLRQRQAGLGTAPAPRSRTRVRTV